MGFIEDVKRLAERAPGMLPNLQTEEATKNALVMPFIAALGYNVFDPLEVIPEFTADVGLKKGEKVDYAIKVGDEVVILFECKRASESLDIRHMSQLFRYFSVTRARIGVLTNGVVYRFFSDIEAPNKMDEHPFLEIDLRALKDVQLRELERITKGSFDLETMLSAASDLKYMRAIRQFLESQFDEPHEEFVRLCFNQASTGGRFGKSSREQFTRIVKRVLQQTVSDRVADRIRHALQQNEEAPESATAAAPAPPAPDTESATAPAAEDESDVETTEDEIAGFQIVRAIVCSVVAPDRVTIRDVKSYCGVLLDNNNRKPICRLHFNTKQKYLGVFDSDKNETREPIESVAEIYKFADALRAVVKSYVEDEVEPTDDG